MMEQFLEKNKKIILSAVLLLSVFLITFRFTETPKVWLDEGVFTEIAKNLAWHGVQGIQTEPGKFFIMGSLATSGYPLIFPVALSFKIFGNGVWQARLPMILYMFALVILFYLFAKRKYGFIPALLAVLGLISFSPFYGNGRVVLGEVPGLVFLVLGALLCLVWEEGDFASSKYAFLAGLALGLSSASKPVYLIVLCATLFLNYILFFKKLKNKKTVWAFVSGFILPIILWLFVQFPSISYLSQSIHTYLHLASNHEASLPIFQTILKNFIRFFKESTPVLFSFLAVWIVISLFLRVFRKKGFPVTIAESIIAIFILLNWLAYLLGTGWYRYFFPAHALLYLLFPGAILTLWNISDSKFFRRSLVVISILLVLLQMYHLIFLSDTSFVVRRTRNAALAGLLSEVPVSKTILFYNTIEAAFMFHGSNYYQYLSIGDSVDAGDKNALSHPFTDFILAPVDPNNPDLTLPCYDRQAANGYYLFKRIAGCKSK